MTGPLTDKDLVAELAAVGVSVRSAWDLVNTSDSDGSAVPVLVSWLGRLPVLELVGREYIALYEGVVRTLTAKEARPLAAEPRVEDFWRVENEHVRWTIGNALCAVADRSVVDRLLEIVQESRFGASRQMVVSGLGRIGRGRADVVDTMIGLLPAEEVKLHAVGALGQLGATDARSQIEKNCCAMNVRSCGGPRNVFFAGSIGSTSAPASH